MNFEIHGARRIMLRGNFESFSRDELPEQQLKKLKLDDDVPPPHAFFTTQASRPVLMTYGLRIFIPLVLRKSPRVSRRSNFSR